MNIGRVFIDRKSFSMLHCELLYLLNMVLSGDLHQEKSLSKTETTGRLLGQSATSETTTKFRRVSTSRKEKKYLTRE